MKFNLIVLRARDMQALAAFYTCLGMVFTKHRHGNGPEHYGTEDCGVVLEIYPQRSSSDLTTGVRIGFEVTCIDEVLVRLQDYDYNVVSAPKESPWGRRMVLDDPEGHRIELTEQ